LPRRAILARVASRPIRSDFHGDDVPEMRVGRYGSRSEEGSKMHGQQARAMKVEAARSDRSSAKAALTSRLRGGVNEPRESTIMAGEVADPA